MPRKVTMHSFGLATLLITVILAASGLASAAITFINPPPSPDLKTLFKFDYTSNAVCPLGSVVEVAWTGIEGTSIPFSIRVLQVEVDRTGFGISYAQAYEYMIRQPLSPPPRYLPSQNTFLTSPGRSQWHKHRQQQLGRRDGQEPNLLQHLSALRHLHGQFHGRAVPHVQRH